jgi:hypothetical protein
VNWLHVSRKSLVSKPQIIELQIIEIDDLRLQNGIGELHTSLQMQCRDPLPHTYE